MKYPYDAAFEPPFPAGPVMLRNSEEGLRTETCSPAGYRFGWLLVPIAYLEEILAPPIADTHIRAMGRVRAAQVFEVDLELGNLLLPAFSWWVTNREPRSYWAATCSTSCACCLMVRPARLT